MRSYNTHSRNQNGSSFGLLLARYDLESCPLHLKCYWLFTISVRYVGGEEEHLVTMSKLTIHTKYTVCHICYVHTCALLLAFSALV